MTGVRQDIELIKGLAETSDIVLTGALKALADDDLRYVRELIEAAQKINGHIRRYPT